MGAPATEPTTSGGSVLEKGRLLRTIQGGVGQVAPRDVPAVTSCDI